VGLSERSERNPHRSERTKPFVGIRAGLSPTTDKQTFYTKRIGYILVKIITVITEKNKQRPVYFELPESPIRGIPLVSEGQRLSIGLVEIGCRRSGKRRQLRNKRLLMQKYWRDHYTRRHNIIWTPEIYRTLAHYDPHDKNPLPVGRGADPDAIITYQYISQEMLAALTEYDKCRIYGAVERGRPRHVLEEILETDDAKRLHTLIAHQRHNPKMSDLRGIMAEIISQKDIEAALSKGMSMYRNSDVAYFNRTFRNGTEIDGILIFYGEEPFLVLLETLKEYNHIVVRDRWKDKVSDQHRIAV